MWVFRKKIFFFGSWHCFSEPSTWVWNWSRECDTWFESADCSDFKWSCWLIKWILPSSLVSSCNERIPSRWCVELSGLNEKSLIWEPRFYFKYIIQFLLFFQNHTWKYFTRWNEHSYWLKRVYDAIIKSESEYPNQILMSISNHKIHNQCGYKLVLAFSLESDKLWEFQILSMSIQFLLPKLCDVINQKFARLFAMAINKNRIFNILLTAIKTVVFCCSTI